MNFYNKQKPIVLIGMPGSGKTTFGRFLAEKLSCAFVDADRDLEADINMTIPELFETKGEALFRELERQKIKDLLMRKDCVIATGGGAIMSDITRERIKKFGTSIWLDVDLNVLVERVKNQEDRPLLTNKDAFETLNNLYQSRKNHYAEADFRLKIDKDHSLEDMFEMLKAELN